MNPYSDLPLFYMDEIDNLAWAAAGGFPLDLAESIAWLTEPGFVGDE